ncbi:MAG: ribosome-associated translation inhibitor RaiA [Caulobacteraceae bacterium]|nr:ribosome-associated translation inhibitor RaiA [Caulobacter sp.]
MTLRVSGKNLQIGEALRSHVHDRIDGVVAKYHAGAPTGHVTIEPEGSGFRADCTLFLKSGITLHVEAIAQEPYSTFDKAADRIERRLRDHRKRLTGRHADSAEDHMGALASDAALTAREPDAVADADEETGAYPAVVAESPSAFKEMTVAAAVAALDRADCGVVVFRYPENQRINLVYRRADGNIGWIDPFRPLNGHSG